jgi:RimJ/RimL family protein N-acetyltransferase
MFSRRLRAEWATAAGTLLAFEPSPAEVRARAAELAVAYNDTHNRAMMANTIEFTDRDVVSHYEAMAAEGARQLFLYDRTRDAFVGDADFRNIAGGRGEFAILIAAQGAQGKGLGTRFAILLHALAFRAFGLERVYVTILPQNAPSRRLFAKLGYGVDTSPEARAYVDHELDVSMSLAKGEFERAHAAAIAGVVVTDAGATPDD